MLAVLVLSLVVCSLCQPACLVADCSKVMAGLLVRLPGSCAGNLTACQNELRFQIAAIRPTDAETQFATQSQILLAEQQACLSFLAAKFLPNERDEQRCNNFQLLLALRAKISRLAGNFDFVWTQGWKGFVFFIFLC